MNKKINYIIINFLVLLGASGIFIYDYYDIKDVFLGIKTSQLVVLSAVAIIVHIIKATRLYLTLYGQEINSIMYLTTYCKATPVSMILPFKLGEFFRMYSYGILTGTFVKGIVIVLLDRFMDTIALITIIGVLGLIFGGQITIVTYVLILFVIAIFSLYYAYPGIYCFWKNYLLKAKASEHKLNVLKLLGRIDDLYLEIKNVVKGRGFILYFMSLIAWGIEICGFYIVSQIIGNGATYPKITNYLTAAIGSCDSIEMDRVIVISVIILIISYMVIKIRDCLFRKRGIDNESNCSI